MKLKNLIFTTFLIIFFGSCVKDTIKPIVEYPQINPVPVSYMNEIQPEFTSKCVSCHGGSIAPDLRAANSYNSLFAENQIDTITPSNSILYVKIIAGGSMVSYTNQAYANKVLKWIQEGAKNN